MKKQKTFWPYGILLSIFAIVCACIFTVYYSLDFPVHMDDFYFDKYQNVENGFNEIQIKQAKFDKDFNFDKNATIYENGVLNQNPPQKMKNNKITPYLPAVDVDKSIKLVFDTNATKLTAKIILTRPDTTEFDKNLNFSLKNNKFVINDIKLASVGRWQVKMKLTANDDAVGFYTFDFFAK